ncbi:hypothetical protein SH611_06925 [Geminicoccaceae bacterium 1502E]|nr:hypothetical protein [Geminicoccaceae bacterium 1502E]
MAWRQSFDSYRPTKTMWFWSTAAAVVAAIILGFSWGGWVTGGTAGSMARNAAEDARTQLAASLCVNRFMAASDASVQLAALKEKSSYSRGSFIEAGKWGDLPGATKLNDRDVARACGDLLAVMDAPSA